MPMRARFTDGIASAEGWSYHEGQEVVVGRVFGEGEVPEDRARLWLSSGLLLAVRTTQEIAAPPARDQAALIRSKSRR